MNTATHNPYIGPRTFLKEERHLFFGRDREARDLTALVVTERLVLFYAQSGAGKSSLINTCLIPELAENLYEVLPVARVSGDAPEGIKVGNIYAYNLMRSLIRREIDPASLADLPLSRFFGRLNEDENGYYYDSQLEKPIRSDHEEVMWRRALIIDQFEELFTTHQGSWEQREGFFRQLAQAMQDDPYLWVVLVMREDYIAALDPYAHILPSGLRTRYYMQRLERTAAIKAVRKPVEHLRPYEAGVAEKLVEDLSSVKVQKPDGTQTFQPGQYVEPVQLQVVCYGLWENLPHQKHSITDQDLLEVGDVDEALAKYYAGRIAGVAQAKNVKERLIREWIEKKLIAPGGIRSMVLQETGGTNSGISDDVIQSLQSDLVRAENRGGAIWYELTHDRLVEPIRENNKKWFDENLSPLQRQAKLWNDQGKSESWLLRDDALVEMEKWASENPTEMTPLESEYLEACRKQQDEQEQKILRQKEEQEREVEKQKLEAAERLAAEQKKLADEQTRSARRALRLSALALGLLVFAVAAAFLALGQSRRATDFAHSASTSEALAQVARTTAIAGADQANLAKGTAQASESDAQKNADQALAGNLVAQADSVKNSDYPLALLLGLEAYYRNDSLLTRTTLFQLLQFTKYTRQFGFGGTVSSVDVSPDGSIVAVASCKGYDNKRQCTAGGVSLYDSSLDKSKVREITGNLGMVYSLAFHQYPDRLVLAVSGCVPSGSGCLSNLGQISLWEIPPAPDEPKKLFNTLESPSGKMHSGLVKAITFSPDGNLLASGSNDTTIIIWGLSDLKRPERYATMTGHTSFVNSVKFSPDGKTLVSASDDTTIRVWDVTEPKRPIFVGYALNVHQAPINTIVFSPDDTLFASASSDNQVILWKWTSNRRSLDVQKILRGHTGYVTSIAFSPDGKLLASAGFDNSILLWDIDQNSQIGPPLKIHSATINSIAFGGDQPQLPGLYLISGSDDRTLIKWDLSARQPISRSLERTGSELQLTAQNAKYEASANGQQVEVKRLQSSDSFLVLTGFTAQILNVEFDAENPDKLFTMDQDQQSTNWYTEWVIDPQIWVTLACDAIQENITDQQWFRFLQNLSGRPPAEQCITKP